jgi:mono/diheme cytochrome c family protein
MTFLRALLLIVAIVAALGGAVGYSIVRRGLSARDEPTWAEEVLARTTRRLATPQAARSRRNPVAASDAVIEEGLAHFADHCASCHANNGSGDTELGRALYPKAPDMRAAATQGMTDGELFSIIENGVRLTGMPAWGTGTPEGEEASWKLVHFIRRLPILTGDELERMEALNPKSPDVFREEEEIRRFLEGEAAAPAATPNSLPPAKKHHE